MFPSPFQSTHPLRGATTRLDAVAGRAIISIHAPLAGCDLVKSISRFARNTFQSTHPLRGATCSTPPYSENMSFQSTHPLRGATRSIPHQTIGLRRISIHAPLAGCDIWYSDRCVASSIFQSTHPLRGATTRLDAVTGRAIISIHAPLAGCDKPTNTNAKSLFTFQSTHPSRGATLVTLVTCTPFGVFQSTHPLRGATAGAELLAVPGLISIHAPLAGCPFFPGGIPTHRRRRTHPVSGKKCAYPG